MNILICDDDKLYVDMIRKYVDEFFVEHKITDYKVYEYYSGDEAAKNSEKIDIAFLDVEMNGINGIEASTILRKNNKDIIVFIITSYIKRRFVRFYYRTCIRRTNRKTIYFLWKTTFR